LASAAGPNLTVGLADDGRKPRPNVASFLGGALKWQNLPKLKSRSLNWAWMNITIAHIVLTRKDVAFGRVPMRFDTVKEEK